jgi:hypothetical protein
MRRPEPARRSGAADEVVAGGDHQPAHHRLITEVHIGADVAGDAAEAEADQHVAELGDGGEHHDAGEVRQGEESGDFAEEEKDRAHPGQGHRVERCEGEHGW